MRGLVVGAVILILVAACSERGTRILTDYSSETFGFELALPEDLARSGWGVVDAEDATVFHTFSPPDTSTWQAVAVVVPPGSSFPLLSPIFIDIFNVKNPAISPTELADRKAARVGDRVLARDAFSSAGLNIATIVHGQGDDVNYEAYAVGNGLGYAILAQGAPDTSATATTFRVDTSAYGRIVRSLRLTPPR